MGPTHTHTRRQAPPGAGAQRGSKAGIQLPFRDPAQEPMSCRFRSALMSSVPSLRLKPQDTRPHPESTHAPSWGTPAPAPPPCVILALPLKDRKVSLPRGRHTTTALSPLL